MPQFAPNLSPARNFAGRRLGAYIDGQIVQSPGSSLRDIFDPATGQVLAQVFDSDAATVDAAVASAKRAFEDGRWSSRPAPERERVLMRLADLIETNGEELAELETLNQGKSIGLSRFFDVAWSVNYVRYIAGLATKVTGETLDLSIGFPPGVRYTGMTLREPIGVVAGIAPWNFPLAIGLWKVIPALAAGCTAVLKPSELTPLTALRLAELATEAGLPAGALNVVPGAGATGQALASHRDVAKITFTGSAATGRRVGQAALENLSRFTLELGGKNPAIFCEDVDVAAALPGAITAAYLNQGQVCAAASRFYVHRKRLDAMVEALSGAIQTMSIGPGMDPTAQINPLVSAAQRDRVQSFLDGVDRSGATTIVRGDAAPEQGYFVSPHLILNPSADAAVQREEVFGPVLTITPFDDYDEVVAAANDSPYGLGASIWTNDLARSMRMTRAIRAGTVWVNTHALLDPAMPFGGFKQSGIGREFGKDALGPFLETKSVCIATPA